MWYQLFKYLEQYWLSTVWKKYPGLVRDGKYVDDIQLLRIWHQTLQITRLGGTSLILYGLLNYFGSMEWKKFKMIAEERTYLVRIQFNSSIHKRVFYYQCCLSFSWLILSSLLLHHTGLLLTKHGQLYQESIYYWILFSPLAKCLFSEFYY